jgi:hypothetical protein
MSQIEPTEFDRDATGDGSNSVNGNASIEGAPRTDREAARALYEAKKREQELRREAKRAEKAERAAEKKRNASSDSKRNATTGEKTAKRNRAEKNADASSSNGGKFRLGRKSGADAEISANRREIPVTGFDLLNGSFATTARVRVISIVVVSILLGVELLVGLRGVAAKFEEAGVRRSIEDVRAERERVISAFGASTGIEGVTEVQIIERERALSAALQEAVLSQPDIIGLYNDLRRFDGLGVSVISIAAARPVAKKPTPAAEGEDKPAKPAAPIPTNAVVTITAEATDFGSVVAWTKRVQELPQITDVTSTRQGLKVTVTAQFSPQYVAAAGADLLTSLGVSLNTTNEATTQTGGNP